MELEGVAGVANLRAQLVFDCAALSKGAFGGVYTACAASLASWVRNFDCVGLYTILTSLELRNQRALVRVAICQT